MKSILSLPLRATSVLLLVILLFQQAGFSAAAAQQAGPAGSSQAPTQPSSSVPDTTPDGHIPAQIAAARTVFLSNGGADAGFPIDATRAYNDLYAALQAWRHYRLVASPDQAELIFELHDAATITSIAGVDGNVSSITSPVFQLKIIDARTRVLLWTVTSPVYAVGRKQQLQRWVSLSERNLVSRIKGLAAEPVSPAELADLTTTPPNHSKRIFLIFGGIFVASAVTGALLYRHGVANGKQSQDDFCAAHNIPLSMCAGG